MPDEGGKPGPVAMVLLSCPESWVQAKEEKLSGGSGGPPDTQMWLHRAHLGCSFGWKNEQSQECVRKMPGQNPPASTSVTVINDLQPRNDHGASKSCLWNSPSALTFTASLKKNPQSQFNRSQASENGISTCSVNPSSKH